MAQNNFNLKRANSFPIGILEQCIDPGVDITTTDFVDNNGFFIKVDGSEGNINVIPFGQDSPILTRFTNAGDGWNTLLCKKIIGGVNNTATNIKVGR